MSEPLHVKYRPARWADVVGQEPVVASLQRALEKESRPHAFLFTGPSGTGKTTLARILALEMGVEPANVIEVDAASNSGVEAMRALTATSAYRGFGAHPNKMVIVDECHSLSKQAWQSLLKPIEEPPAHVFYGFCTTEADRVPDTIKTRCHLYALKEVRPRELEDLMTRVLAAEAVEFFPQAVTEIARAAEGSPRRALVYLSMCLGAEDIEEVREILEQPLEANEAIDLARLLFARRGQSLTALQGLLKAMKEQDPESVRLQVLAYAMKVFEDAKDKQTLRCLEVMEEFSEPCRRSERMVPIALAAARLILLGEDDGRG